MPVHLLGHSTRLHTCMRTAFTELAGAPPRTREARPRAWHLFVGAEAHVALTTRVENGRFEKEEQADLFSDLFHPQRAGKAEGIQALMCLRL